MTRGCVVVVWPEAMSQGVAEGHTAAGSPKKGHDRPREACQRANLKGANPQGGGRPGQQGGAGCEQDLHASGAVHGAAMKTV